MARKAEKADSGDAGEAGSPVPPVIEEVRLLVQLMLEHDLGEVDITDGQRKILLKRSSGGGGVSEAPPAVQAAPAAAAPEADEHPPAEELLEIKSPMVGTFYSSPGPESGPYASVGTPVDEETVVCIVEAMKVMNEVKAECTGTIAEVCVQNAHPVEYGQVLFRVRGA